MGGKSKAPPPPDYGPLAEASKEAAEVSAKIAREQLDWAKDQYFMDREVTDLVIESALDRLDTQDEVAAKDRERHIRTKRVIEVGYEEARRICGEEHMRDRPEQCPVVVLRINE